MNFEIAVEVIQELVNLGVEEFVVCPGARNVPLVNVLVNEERLKKWWCYEERSSAFFALGRIRQTERPVAVVTTSGTAVAELLPATMEAYYTSQPLVLLTADRPRRFRFCNAPQTCNQKQMFGMYTPFAFDLEKEERFSVSEWQGRDPLHINVCFEEPEKKVFSTRPLSYPLFRERMWEGEKADVQPFLERADKLLVIVSTLRLKAQKAVLEFVKKLGADVYAEGVSGIRDKLPLVEPKLDLYTHVLRIGGVPTHRIWRDIQEKQCVEVLSLTENPFAGMSWGNFNHCNLEFLPDPVAKPRQASEISPKQGLFYELSSRIPKGSLVYLGNSLPIRDWDKGATLEDRQFDIQASRGLNGIDGQISTFLGLAKENLPNYAILGDLTTLYDLGGPWFLSQIKAKAITIIVINNYGGRIFEPMFPMPEMLNSHKLSFEPVAKLWGMRYERWEKVPEQIHYEGARLVEIII